MEKSPSWDDIYMTMVYLVASKSKDNRTHVGAVVVGPDNEVRSTGYNGFVRGLDDSNLERQQKSEKNYWMEHAERNVLFNAVRIGVSLKGCKIYTNGIPCMDCARAIIQSGIKEIIIDKNSNIGNNERWDEHTKRSLEMFNEIGIKVRYYDGQFLEIHKFINGEKISLV
ncbi:MAG: cytidine/deoxycytidylate deaminase family protein [Candidatus Nanoarchaeia archaeon]